MNFVAVTSSKKQGNNPLNRPLHAVVNDLALHHQRAQRPLRRHAYRLSQVITYGAALPQVYVN